MHRGETVWVKIASLYVTPMSCLHCPQFSFTHAVDYRKPHRKNGCRFRPAFVASFRRKKWYLERAIFFKVWYRHSRLRLYPHFSALFVLADLWPQRAHFVILVLVKFRVRFLSVFLYECIMYRDKKCGPSVGRVRCQYSFSLRVVLLLIRKERFLNVSFRCCHWRSRNGNRLHQMGWDNMDNDALVFLSFISFSWDKTVLRYRVVCWMHNWGFCQGLHFVRFAHAIPRR